MYIYHSVWVRDINSEAPTLESAPIVNKFSDVFLNNFPSVASKKEINFARNPTHLYSSLLYYLGCA